MRVIAGAATGFGAQSFLRQGVGGMLDTSESQDGFGDVLGVGGYTAMASTTSRSESPMRVSGAPSQSGCFAVIYGSASGITTAGNQFWHEDVPGVPGSEIGDWFGSSVM